MTDHKVINGDCIEAMRKMPSGCVDMIFADPPYFVRANKSFNRYESTKYQGCDDNWDEFENQQEYESFTRDWLAECKRLLKKDGTIWVIGGMQCVFAIGHIMQELGFWLINDVIWNKVNPTPNFRGSKLVNSHETILWARNGKNSKYTFNYRTAKMMVRDLSGKDKQMGSVWDFHVCKGQERVKDKNGKKLHSTQKPLDLIKRIVLISTRPEDVILDPFGGTMTTAVAAKVTGRNSISIERSMEYCEAGLKRIETVSQENGKYDNPTIDVKPERVSVRQMVDDGYIIDGEAVYMDGVPFGTIDSKGKITHGSEITDMHSYAAQARNSKRPRLNGFDHWCVDRNGQKVLLRDIREKYRNRNNNVERSN